MWELVCGQSAGASLKQAQRGPAFAGDRRGVLCPELMLSAGSLRDFPPETGRAGVLSECCGGEDAAREQAARNRAALDTLQNAARTGQPVRVWAAPAAEEVCLFALAMDLLQGARGPVSAVWVPLLQPRPDGTLAGLRGLGELTPARWSAFLSLEQPVDPAQRAAWAHLWRAARAESAPLRVLLNGSLVGVPDCFFDGVLWDSMPARGRFSAGQAVGRALARLPGVPDGVLAARLRRLTEQGRLRVCRDGAFYYETELERCAE